MTPPPLADAGPAPLRSPQGAALVAATVLASLVAFVDANLVNVAVPAISRELHAGVAEIQWIVTGYLVTVAAFLLMAGALADHFGRKPVLVVGLVIMLLASIECAAAPTSAALIAARLVQGVGGALVVPCSLALLNGSLRPRDRARGIGVWAGVSTLGTTLGPYGGGWLVDHESWRYVFLLNVPLITAALLVLWRAREVRAAARPLSVDVTGAALTVAGIAGAIYALTAAPTDGWGSPFVLATGIVGLGCLVALPFAEARQRAPMLRVALFRSPQFSAINVSTILLYGALAAAGYLVVLYCQVRLGYSATAAGAALVPESLVFLIVSPFVGGWVARIGSRWPMTIGTLIVAGALTWLAGARPGQSYAQAILPGAILWGLGIGLTVAPLTAGVLAAVADADLGEATAINDATSRVGGVVVIALVPALIGAGGARSLAGPLAEGYPAAMLVMATLCVGAALVGALFVSSRSVPMQRMPAASPRVHSCAAVKPVAVK